MKNGRVCLIDPTTKRFTNVVVELTSAGWTAIWQWVQERALEPELQDENEWRKHALRSVNLAPPGEELVVCMRGAVSRSGYLEALRLQPHWYRRIAPPVRELEPLGMMT